MRAQVGNRAVSFQQSAVIKSWLSVPAETHEEMTQLPFSIALF